MHMRAEVIHFYGSLQKEVLATRYTTKLKLYSNVAAFKCYKRNVSF